MKKIAIIPARGGSKRIPRKNIRTFLGKPIIAYSIEAAVESDVFDEVMVSTDDEEIAMIAKDYGAKVPFLRSLKNSDDYATTVDVIIEVLGTYKESHINFDYGCCIYPTAPFISTTLLKHSLDELLNNKMDTVFPVLPFGFPIQRAVKINKQNRIEMFEPEQMFSRSQDLEKAYHDAGQFYWFRSEAIVKQKKLWTDNSGVVILDEMVAHDIDTMEDWRIAEFKFKLMLDGKA